MKLRRREKRQARQGDLNDPFWRVARITLPDGSQTTFSYLGERVVQRTQRVGTPNFVS